jgi:hypothetical protein
MSNFATELRRVHTWRAAGVASAIVVTMLLIGLWQVQQAAGRIRTEQLAASSAVGELVGSATSGQTFVSAFPGLARVEVLMASYGRQVTGTFLFHLRDAAGAGDDLVVLACDASQVRDNAFYVFKFPPIRDSAGRSLYFYLEAPQARPGNAITLLGSTQDTLTDGEAVFQGVQGGEVRDLAFRVRYDTTLPERFSVVLDRLSASKPGLLGDPWWYVVLAAAQMALLYVLIFRAAGLGLADRDEEARP